MIGSAGIIEGMHTSVLEIYPYSLIAKLILCFSDILNSTVISPAILCCSRIVFALVPFVLHSEEQHMAHLKKLIL